MKRDQVLDRTRHWFDAGHYQSLLSRRVAMPTASDQPGNQDVLRAYLSQEMVPDLMACGFECQVFDNPVADAPPLMVARRIEGQGLPCPDLWAWRCDQWTGQPVAKRAATLADDDRG